MNPLILATGVLALLGSRPVATEPSKTATVTLALTAYSSNTNSLALGPVGTSEVQITELWISIKDVRLRDVASCDRPKARAELKGPFTAELVGAKGGPLPALSTEPGHFCRVDATLRRSAAKAEGTPARLRGYSIFVRGRLRDGASFEVRSRLAATLIVRSVDPQGFAVAAGAGRLFLAVDAARWMNGLDLATADPEGGTGPGHVLRIDDKTNPALLARFEKNVPPGLGLFRDEDGDGVLSPRERAPTARLGAAAAE